MPKIVDHEARRRELAEALWRVVVRGGAGSVSVRTVAAEAGWSSGALRHYFPEQADLIASAMALVTERVTARIQALEPEGTLFEKVLALVEQLVPLDEERRIEAEVWFSFVTQARLDPRLEELTKDVFRETRDFLALIVSQAGIRESETVRLHALVDGLSIQLLLYPGLLTAEEVHEELARHLRQIMP